MRTWAKASTPAALLAVAVMSFGGGTASADTDGDHSIGGGNQVNLPVTLPIDISGNAVGVAGDSSASSTGGATVVDEGRGGGNGNRTSGRSSVLGGNQVDAPISAPVNACGNAVSLFGNSDAGCKGGATVRKSGKGGAGGNRTDGDHSIIGGNQVTAPISAPVNACGNAVAIFGDAAAGCVGGATVRDSGAGAGGNRTSGRSSVLGGNQAVAPITAPINICGNSVAAFGDAFSGCKGGASAHSHGRRHQSSHHVPRGSTGNDTDGRFGAGSGNQVVAPITLPVNVCGNSVGNATSGCKGGATAHQHGAGSGAGGNTTSGRSGVLSGNQVVAPITAPINVCGNAVGVAGKAFAGCTGGVSVKNGGKGSGGNRTSGRSGVLSGNQVVAPITAPVNVCGNAAAVLGEANAHCKGGASVHGKGVAAGGNRTSGRSGVLSGNQVVAPITAPVNACGNAAAALGDAAAGCLGGAHVGKPGGPHKGYQSKASGGGTVPNLPALPADLGNDKEMSGGLPVVGDVAGSLGLPQVPALPGLPTAPEKPVKTPAKPVKRHTGQPSGGALGPASGLVSATPVGGAVKSVTRGLPTGDLGLMSAEQPAGVTGMSTASLLALALGGLFAVTASLFAATRRFRPTTK